MIITTKMAVGGKLVLFTTVDVLATIQFPCLQLALRCGMEQHVDSEVTTFGVFQPMDGLSTKSWP